MLSKDQCQLTTRPKITTNLDERQNNIVRRSKKRGISVFIAIIIAFSFSNIIMGVIVPNYQVQYSPITNFFYTFHFMCGRV